MMTKHLDELGLNESATVLSLDATGHLRPRLIALGLTPGTPVVLRKCAPLGDPLEIRVRRCSLSIRRRDAHQILIETGDSPV